MGGQGDPFSAQKALHIGQLFFEVGEREVQFLALRFHFGTALQRDLVGALQLRLLLVARIIALQQLADVFEAEAKALAAQEQLEPRPVAPASIQFAMSSPLVSPRPKPLSQRGFPMMALHPHTLPPSDIRFTQNPISRILFAAFSRKAPSRLAGPSRHDSATAARWRR